MINLNVTLLVQLAIFLGLMAALNALLFRPMVRVLEERKARTEGRKREAAQADAEAEAILLEYQKRMQEARAAGERARGELVKQGEGERQRMTEAAAAEAERTVSELRARVRAEAQQARRVLEAEAKDLASSAAARILGRSI